MSDQDETIGGPQISPISPSPPPRSLLFLAGNPLPVWVPPLLYLFLGFVFLWRPLFSGDVFLPATLLGHVAPWKTTSLYPQLPPWNPLRWDGIGQFYPWRKFAAETLRSGTLPLWNPYQFSGTPFVANSQSAVFYPGNLLFLLIPDTAYAFGWTGLLHLTLCGWFTYLLLRRLRASEISALAGGVVFAYSAWQIAWLQLPTFLATSCWFPLLLRQIYSGSRLSPADSRTVYDGSERQPEPRSGSLVKFDITLILSRFGAVGDALGVGSVMGLMLLAGHLQIAFYGLLAGLCMAAGLLVTRRAPLRRLIPWTAGLLLGLAFAMPQLLPSAELSRISHRVGKPSAAGYRAYTEYGLPAFALASLALPNITGGDCDPANLYWGYYRKRLPNGTTIGVLHNPSETAVYVGILPLLLGLLALVRGFARKGVDRRVVFFALLAASVLLLALGTPLNVLLYYGIPGFAQSGSPARCLVLWALAWSTLAALGLDQLQLRLPSGRELTIVFGSFIGVLVFGLKLVSSSLAAPPPQLSSLPLLGEVLSRIGADWARLAIMSVVALALFVWPALRETREEAPKGYPGKREETTPSPSQQTSETPALPTASLTLSPSHPLTLSPPHPLFPLLLAALLIVADLFWAGMGSNPTARREQVYPETNGIAYLREHAGHDRIFPVNQRWSLFASPSLALPAVMPPNAATVFRLRDVQGYDSLFWGRYKGYANEFARPNRGGLLDASPPEVGNIVFFQNANAPGMERTAARFALAVPYDSRGFAPEAVPPTTPLDTGDSGMMVYALPENGGRARLAPPGAESPVAWLQDDPTRIALTVNTPFASVLSLYDADMPGWHAAVDGQEAQSISDESSAVVRRVRLPAGRHTVSFRYTPQSFRLGLYIALAALCLSAALAAAMICTPQRDSPAPSMPGSEYPG